MASPEYIRLHKRYFSPAFIQQFNLTDLIDKDGYVYCEINKGMHGLKQAAILAYKQLVKRLSRFGYVPISMTNGLWKHETKRTLFALCVNDFGVKYDSLEDLQHLIGALKAHYEITIDMEGRNFCGLQLEWNYDAGYVDISMPTYVQKKLNKFRHTPPTRPQYAPHKWVKPASSNFAMKLRTARLDRASGLQAYKTLWCSKFRYCAPVVGFFDRQLLHIQTKII